MLDNTIQDVRFAVRSLAKNPGVTAIAVLSLGLGIGANTAIFSIIDTVLVKLLPVRDPQELVLLSDPASSGVSMGSQGGVRGLFSYGEYEHIRDKQQVFTDMYASESNADRLNASVDGGAPGANMDFCRVIKGPETPDSKFFGWANESGSSNLKSDGTAVRASV